MPNELAATPALPADTTPESEALWTILRSRGTVSDKVSSRLLTAADVPSLLAMRQAATSANQPASRSAALATLERLFQHYPQAATEAGHKAFWEDWAEDVEGIPLDVLTAACRDWRRSTEKWRPTAGQLLALVDRGYLADVKLIDMALKGLGKSPVDGH